MSFRRGVFGVVLVLASGCGPTTYVDFCRQSYAAQCKNLFTCQPSAASTFGTVEGCVSSLESRLACSSYEPLNCSLDGAAAQRCLNALENAACSSTFTLPGACSEMQCTPTGGTGQVTCRSSESNGGGAACTLDLSSCSDGSTYRLQCSGSSCQCSKDGVAGMAIAYGACDRSRLEQECGYGFK